jgi:hypothetical protein
MYSHHIGRIVPPLRCDRRLPARGEVEAADHDHREDGRRQEPREDGALADRGGSGRVDICGEPVHAARVPPLDVGDGPVR